MLSNWTKGLEDLPTTSVIASAPDICYRVIYSSCLVGTDPYTLELSDDYLNAFHSISEYVSKNGKVGFTSCVKCRIGN